MRLSDGISGNTHKASLLSFGISDLFLLCLIWPVLRAWTQAASLAIACRTLSGHFRLVLAAG